MPPLSVGHRPLLGSKAVKAALALRHASTTGRGKDDLTVQAARLMTEPWLRR